MTVYRDSDLVFRFQGYLDLLNLVQEMFNSGGLTFSEYFMYISTLHEIIKEWLIWGSKRLV